MSVALPLPIYRPSSFFTLARHSSSAILSTRFHPMPLELHEFQPLLNRFFVLQKDVFTSSAGDVSTGRSSKEASPCLQFAP